MRRTSRWQLFALYVAGSNWHWALKTGDLIDWVFVGIGAAFLALVLIDEDAVMRLTR